MAGPTPVNPNRISHQTFESNLQHVGGQRQVTGRQADEKNKAGATAEPDRVELSHADHAREAAENASQVGALQSHAREEAGEAATEESGRNLPVVYREHLPAVIEDKEHLPAVIEGGENALVPVKSQLPVPVKDGEVLEPVYPGTVDQGMSPYVPAGANGGAPPPPGGGPPPDGVPPGAPGPGGPQPGSQADQAARWKQFQDEQQQVNQIFMQMAADRQKWMMEMWKIIQDTQTKMYEIMQSAILYRAQVHDKINQMWDSVIRGGP